tara:strand:- start:116 stop:610 length:495 start_codon:yes stop_codon:yes gene_type:complete
VSDDNKKEDFQPRSSSMKEWKKKYYDKDDTETKMDVENENQATPIEEGSSTDLSHKKFCLILMGLAVGGGIFTFLGYSPTPCDNNSIFEALGGVAFWFSMIGIPINVIIWISSLFDEVIRSSEVFVLSVAHVIVWVLTLFIFAEYIFQDMFCGACMGFPGEDCS